MEIIWILRILFFASIFGLLFLIPTKTFMHFKYRKLSRGEKSRGIFNIIDFTPQIIPDYFSTVFLFPAFGKNHNPELERMRQRINQIVLIIYSCIIILISGGIISQYIK